MTALADAAPEVFWLDDPTRPEPSPPLVGDTSADLVVVGGGYTGLWTALLARVRWPGRSVLLVEAGRCGDQASGRNGGFASASLTHGFGNGLDRWPDELDELDRLGAQNLHEMGETITRLGIDCDWQVTGELTVATAPHEVAEGRELAARMRDHGHSARWLGQDEVRAEVDSPTYLGALLEPETMALVEPARLAWGLRRACLDAGVDVHEETKVLGLTRDGAGLRLRCETGTVRAAAVALATNAFPHSCAGCG